MPRQKKPLEEQYVHAYIPDKAQIALLLQRCKGNHSMAELAKECDVSASTLSRILNGKISKPMDIDLIKKIAYHSAANDPEKMFQNLAKANGWIPKEIYEERNNSYLSESIFRGKEDHTAMRNTIMTGLLERGFPVKIVGIQHQAIKTDLPILTLSSMTVETDIGNGPFLWSFMYIMDSFFESTGGNETEKVLMRMSGWFLEDSWEPEKLKGRRTSFVFKHGTLGIMIDERLWPVKFNNDFSILCAELDREKITFEEGLSRKDGKPVENVFTKPIIEAELSESIGDSTLLDFDVHTGRN